MTWKEAFRQRREVVLATASEDCVPRAIFVTSLGFFDGKLLIGVCQMKRTLDNLKQTGNVSVVAKLKSNYYRLDGKATLYSSGKYFNTAVKRSKPPLPRQAIAVNVKEVFDLDNLKRLF